MTNDEHSGLGGSYELINGVRRLVQRTQDAPSQAASSESGPGPSAELKAADAGVALAPLEVLAPAKPAKK